MMGKGTVAQFTQESEKLEEKIFSIKLSRYRTRGKIDKLGQSLVQVIRLEI